MTINAKAKFGGLSIPKLGVMTAPPTTTGAITISVPQSSNFLAINMSGKFLFTGAFVTSESYLANGIVKIEIDGQVVVQSGTPFRFGRYNGSTEATDVLEAFVDNVSFLVENNIKIWTTCTQSGRKLVAGIYPIQ